MLSLEPNQLYDEVRHAEKVRDEHLSKFDEMVALYHGRAWKDSSHSAPENGSYELSSLLLPRLSYANPSVNVYSLLHTEDAEAAAAVIEQGLSTWIRRNRYRTLGARCALDEMFNFSAVSVQRVGKTYKMPNGEMYHMPGAARVPQRWFGMDPLAHTPEEARYFFRKWVIDKEDAVRLAKAKPNEWSLEAVEALAEDASLDTLGEEWTKAPKRKQVVLYDIWLRGRDAKGEDLPIDYSGTMVTIGACRSASGEYADVVRKAHNHWGHCEGPFVVGGTYSVPDSPWPLGMLTATFEQAEELNSQCRKMAEEMDAYKRLALVDALDHKLAEDIKSKGNLYVIPVQGLASAAGGTKVIPLEVGGTTEQRAAYVQLLRDRFDRNIGQTEAQRGNVTGEGTATEINVAADAASARIAYVVQQRADAAAQCLERIAWYLFNDNKVMFPLDREATDKLKELGVDTKVFQGGSFGAVRFEDLELDIAPYSMERVNEVVAQQRALQKFQLLTEAGPVMLQTPQLGWKKALEGLGNAFNDPDFSELLDTDELKKGQAAMQEAQRVQNAGV